MKRACFERSKVMVDQLRQAGYPLGFDPAVMGEKDAISLRLPTGNWVMISVPEEGPLTLTAVVAETLPEDVGEWIHEIPVPVLGNDARLITDEENNAILELTREGEIVPMVERFQAGVETVLIRLFRAAEQKGPGEPSRGETVYRLLRKRWQTVTVRWNTWWEFSFDFRPGDRWESVMCVTPEGRVHLELVITGNIPEDKREKWLSAINQWHGGNWFLKLYLTDEGLLEGYVDFLLLRDREASETILTKMLDMLTWVYQDCVNYFGDVRCDIFRETWKAAETRV